jgi:hypothetical protein
MEFLWLKRGIQRNPLEPLSRKEVVGTVLGTCYLLFLCLISFRYLEPWIAPLPEDKALHRECVLIASEIAKGSDTAYKETYKLCSRGELK